MNKPHQVLVLTSTYPRWEGDIEPAFVEDLCLGLSKNHDLFVVAPMFPGAKKTEIKGKLKIHRFSYWPTWLPQLAYEGGVMSKLRRFPWLVCAVPFFLASQFFTARRLIKAQDIGVVHAHWIIPQGFVAILLKLFLKNDLKIIVTSHGGDLYTLHGGMLSRLKKWIASKADILTVVSPSMRVHLLGMGVKSDVKVAPMGVDLVNRFRLIEPIKRRKNLVFVGRFVEKKGLVYFLKALKLLRDEKVEVNVDILGDGPERKSLEGYCADNNIEELVNFHGSIPNQYIPVYLNNAAVFVMPSIIADDGDQEGLGLVAIEAMGCGCAVVASDLEAIRHSIDGGVTGVLVEPKNETALAFALKNLLENDDYRCKLANSGRESVIARFDWPICVKRYKDMYHHLLKKN